MMKQEYKRNRHINPEQLMLLTLISVLLLAGGFEIYRIVTEDAYAAYNTYGESNEKEGTVEHFTEEKEDTCYLSLYYPKLEDKQSSEIVQTHRSISIQTKHKYEGMQYIAIDYASKKLSDQYVGLTSVQKIYDADEEQVDGVGDHYTYGTKQRKLTTVQDTPRQSYVQAVKRLVETAGIRTPSITPLQVQVRKDGLMLYTGKGVKGMAFPYKGYKKYIRLANRNIPPLHQKDAITPTEQEVDPNKKMTAFAFDDSPHW